MDDNTLREKYMSANIKSISEEFNRRGLKLDKVDISKLTQTRLIDLYKETRDELLKEELIKRNMRRFI